MLVFVLYLVHNVAVYKIQNEDKHPFYITITYRQYRDTGNIVKGQSLIDNTETQATLCTRHRAKTSIHSSLQSLIDNTETQATLCTRHRTKTSIHSSLQSLIDNTETQAT
jgi:hypothetical protein